MDKLQIVYLPVGELKPYKNNARKHQDKDIEAICTSIREFGFDDPIGIWSDENLIVEGHGRLLAAKKLGMTEVPCIRLDHLDDEQRRAYALAHNKTAELSSWLDDVLVSELGDITSIDMSKLGFNLDIGENPYSAKVKIPCYEPTGAVVSIQDLCNLDKFYELEKEIRESNLSDDEKNFLLISAYRHVVFNYKNIAEYYAANASEEMQNLMEKSALVIIDIDDAMQYGYCRMMNKIEGNQDV